MRTLLTGAKGQLARCLRDRLPEDWELMLPILLRWTLPIPKPASYDQKLPTGCHR